jgi:hypothetical protein
MCSFAVAALCVSQGMEEKAATFNGLAAAIDAWNDDSLDVVGAGSAPSPFTLVDVNTVSDALTHFIRRDCVHFDPPLYAINLRLDLNIVLRGMTMCPEFAH